jgi:hypothetical protein
MRGASCVSMARCDMTMSCVLELENGQAVYGPALRLPKAWRRSDQAWQRRSDSLEACYLLKAAEVVLQRG